MLDAAAVSEGANKLGCAGVGSTAELGEEGAAGIAAFRPAALGPATFGLAGVPGAGVLEGAALGGGDSGEIAGKGVAVRLREGSAVVGFCAAVGDFALDTLVEVVAVDGEAAGIGAGAGEKAQA